MESNLAGGKSKGISLLELLTTISIGSILFGLAVPGMSGLIAQNRTCSQVNTLRASLGLTRTNAITVNERTVLCKSANGKTCTQQGEWNQGWIVFADRDYDHQRSPNERLIHVQPATGPDIEIKYRGFSSSHYVSYRSSGITRTNGSFTVCNPKTPKMAKALILNKSGRIRLSDTLPGNEVIKCGSTNTGS